MQGKDRLPVAVIGAGPVGLAAAAHLVTRGETPLVLEAGPGPGASVRRWGHVRTFSPWRYDVDGAAAALLERHGWTAPPAGEHPTGQELVERYLAPLAALPELRGHVRYGTRVTAIARSGRDRVKTAGRAPTFLLATGYEQVRSVVAALAGDLDSARRVQLELPETGVCSSGLDAGEDAGRATPAAAQAPSCSPARCAAPSSAPLLFARAARPPARAGCC